MADLWMFLQPDEVPAWSANPEAGRKQVLGDAGGSVPLCELRG